MLGINFPELSNFPPKRPLVVGLQCGRRAATSSRLVEVRTNLLLFVYLFTSCSVDDFVHSIDVNIMIFAEMANCLVVKLVDMVDVVHMVESLGFKPSGTSTGGFTP